MTLQTKEAQESEKLVFRTDGRGEAEREADRLEGRLNASNTSNDALREQVKRLTEAGKHERDLWAIIYECEDDPAFLEALRPQLEHLLAALQSDGYTRTPDPDHPSATIIQKEGK